ncbi:hypothetical protein AAKU58_004352 [Oxalobacteraceae bacterium GrIS 1.18]
MAGAVRDISFYEVGEAELFINEYSSNLSSRLTNEFAIETLDSLRHAFVSFAYNGLHQLYTRQENEGWYPKIILTEILEPNDIYILEEIFFIYRGCDRSELDSGNFGQSWSTCKLAASEFAFNHYDSQDWYAVSDRVILQATYCRANVLFSDQTEFGEYEIAVKTEFLSDVTECT